MDDEKDTGGSSAAPGVPRHGRLPPRRACLSDDGQRRGRARRRRRPRADDFYKPANRTVFETIKLLASRGDGCDHLVIDELERSRKLGDVGGEAYILEIAADALAGLSWSHHVQIVKKRAASRRVLAACAALGERAVAADADTRTLVADAVAELMAAQDGSAIAPARGIADLLDADATGAACRAAFRRSTAFAGDSLAEGSACLRAPRARASLR